MRSPIYTWEYILMLVAVTSMEMAMAMGHQQQAENVHGQARRTDP